MNEMNLLITLDQDKQFSEKGVKGSTKVCLPSAIIFALKNESFDKMWGNNETYTASNN